MEGLRRIPGARHVPVIVITAKDLTGEDRQRLSGEVARILKKTAFTSEELIDEIRSLVGPNSEKANQ